MSFGFSISDFALCAKYAHKIYRALKDAPKECQTFAAEVAHLYSFLDALSDDIASVSQQPNGPASLLQARPKLSEYGSRCIELLLVDIAGDPKSHVCGENPALYDLWFNGEGNPSLKQRFSQAKFARKIPRLREAVASIMNKLIAENVNVMRCKQYQTIESQARIELLQQQLLDRVAESHTCFDGIQESQMRIETQLQEILKAQSRQANSVLSGSLDASSPEGRQTWMELGRLLRDEGITPDIVSKNQSLLIQAMKRTIEESTMSPDSASFKTACEYQSLPMSARRSLNIMPTDSISLLSSAPSCGATFSEDFLARSRPTPSPLERKENIEDGIKTLLGGMAKVAQTEDGPEQHIEDIDLVQAYNPEDFSSRETGSRAGVELRSFLCVDSRCGMRFMFESDFINHKIENGCRSGTGNAHPQSKPTRPKAVRPTPTGSNPTRPEPTGTEILSKSDASLVPKILQQSFWPSSYKQNNTLELN